MRWQSDGKDECQFAGHQTLSRGSALTKSSASLRAGERGQNSSGRGGLPRWVEEKGVVVAACVRVRILHA